MHRLLLWAIAGGAALAVCFWATPAWGYLGILQSLGQVTGSSKFIVVLEVEKVSRENKVIVYKKTADLKGSSAALELKHHIAGGEDACDAEAILAWAAPGKTAIFFHDGAHGLVCIGRHWHACAAGKEQPWWTMTRAAHEQSYAYLGSTSKLRSHVAAILEGKTVVVTALDNCELVAYRYLATRELPRAASCPVWRIKAGLQIGGWPRDGVPGAGDAKDVPAWAQALGHADGKRRTEAAAELGRIGPEAAKALPALRKALQDQDPLARLSAAASLVQIDPDTRAGLAVLVAALKDDDAKIRRMAAELLGDIGPDASLASAALGLALQDADLGVRWMAADSLGQIGPGAEPAVPALIETLKDKTIRSAAASALGAIGPAARAAASPLAAALDEADLAYRWTLVAALARIGGPGARPAVPFLVKAIANKRDTDMNCYRALILLEFLGTDGQDAAAAVRAGIQSGRLQRGWLTTTLSRIDPKGAVPLMIADLDSEGVGGALKRYAAAYLGAVGPLAKDALPALTAAAPREPATDFSRICAWAAALVRGDHQAAVPLLLEGLKADSHGYLHRFSREALERLGPEARPALGALLEAAQERDAKVRRSAASVLKRLGLTGWIGYTEFRTDLPGGRHPNQASMRAFIVQADGTRRRALGEDLTAKPDNWTQFAGWSPDGRLAIFTHSANKPDNAALEEKQRTFRFEGRSCDSYFFDTATEQLINVTAVERVSSHNWALSFWPGDPKRLKMIALVAGNWRPYSMDLDGRNKKDLAKDSAAYVYGVSVSPDGKRLAYTIDYQLYLADADGSNARHIPTGHAFNFVPQWSPDSQWLLLLAGEHYNCHPHVLTRDGKDLHKVGDRKGYRGVVDFLDVPDYHGGSSDVPAWSPDGKWIYFTAKIGESVELMRASLDGKEQQLSHTKPGSLNYHPALSPSGQWIVFGSTRSGVRQLYVMPAEGGAALPITSVERGHTAMWAYWQAGAKR
jgi:TolB protein